LGKIALKLKPEIEAKAKEKRRKHHGNQYESGLLTTLTEAQAPPITTRKNWPTLLILVRSL
jgi:hypothetical protein